MKKAIIVAILFVSCTVPSVAQIAVVDVASVRQQIQQLLQMQKELVQLQQMYALYQQQFNLLNAEAQQIKGLPSRYRYTFANWQQFVAGNQYDNTGAWANAITNGDANSIQTGFRNLLPTVQPVDITASPQAQQDWRQQYGLVQLQDASLMTGMKTIGDLRSNMQQNARILAQLEADATSSDPTLQSAKALQQKTLVAMLLMIHTLQDETGRLRLRLTCRCKHSRSNAGREAAN